MSKLFANRRPSELIWAVLVVGLVATVSVGIQAASVAALEPRPPAPQAAQALAGADACRSCHEDQYVAWAASTHGTAGGPPGPETVIAPFGGSPIRFADAVVSPVVDDAGQYVFVVARPGRPPVRYVVSGVVGRGHMVGGGTQGFVSTFPDGTERFLPFDWSADADAWFCNTAFVGGFWVPGADRAALRADGGWLPVTEEMRLTECGDWPPVRVLGTTRRFANCQNCHGSAVQVSYRPEERRYETRVATLRIDCESCHGPAATHIERARAGALSASADLGLPALDTLGVDESLAVCFQCHALKRAVDVGASGDRVATEYSLGLPLVGDSPYLADGRIRTFGYQQTHRSSACYLSGTMTCVDCHDPHTQSYRDPFGTPLAGRWDDGQCTACHASKAADPEAHTFHPPGSDGARCVSCHMPYVQHPDLTDAIPYARADHTIPVPRPGFDEAAGLTSACAGCHQDRSAPALAQQAAEWWGELKPHRPEVTALFAADHSLRTSVRRAADAAADADGAADADADGDGATERPPARPELAALLEAAGLGERYGLAKIMAVDAWVLAATAAPNTPVRDATAAAALAGLARDPDVDVRAIAGAALHAVYDEGPAVGAPDALRARWAGALSQWGAAVARSRGPEAALPFLRKARAVRPADPEALIGLAAGLSALGEHRQAVQAYQEALRHEPDHPVALVNLGLGLESLGREAEAEAAYQRAVQARPREALPHFNLGNVRFRRGDLPGAAAAYRTAVEADPGLARAHFYLAVVLINTGSPEAALPALYNAAEFAPEDEEIRQLLRQLEAALRGPFSR